MTGKDSSCESLLPPLGGSLIWFLLLLHAAACGHKTEAVWLDNNQTDHQKIGKNQQKNKKNKLQIQLSDFYWFLGGHSILFFLFIFKGSASFPTGEEVEQPENSSWHHPKGNLKTLGHIVEFLSRPGLWSLVPGDWTRCRWSNACWL